MRGEKERGRAVEGGGKGEWKGGGKGAGWDGVR